MPSLTLADARFDPRARAEAFQKAKDLADGHLAEVMRVQKEESVRSNWRQRREWEEAWRLYQSEVDYSDKEDWQAKSWVPLPFSTVEQATARIQRSMLDSAEFFGVDGHDPKSKQLANLVWMPLLKLAMEKSAFVNKFADAVKVGFATGISLYLKFRYASYRVPSLGGVTVGPDGAISPVYRTEQQAFLTIDTVPPWMVFRDPRSKSRQQFSGSYIMEEEYVDRAYLLEGQRGGYFRNVAQVPEGISASTMGWDRGPDMESRRRGQAWSPNRFRKPALLTEWYGDLPDENGDIAYPDATMTMANNVIIRGIEDNPIWAVDVMSGRRKWPLIAFPPIAHPLRFEGFGILRAVAPLAMLFSNLFDLMMDGMNWSVNPESELDINLLEDQDDTETFPGKLWLKRGSGRLITPAERGKIEVGSILAVLQYVHQMWENEGFVTAFITGEPGTRSNITLGETEIKTNQSLSIFDSMARNLEAGGRAAVEMAHDFLLQYLTVFSHPSLADVVGPAAASLLAMMSPADRMRELSGNFAYSFTGISTALQKSDMLQRLISAAQLATQGMYAGLTNPAEVLRALFDMMGIRDRITVNDVAMVPATQVAQAAELVRRKLEAGPKVNVSLRGNLPPAMAADLADGSLDHPQMAGPQAAVTGEMLSEPLGTPRAAPAGAPR